MNETFAPIDRAGRVVLPKRVREELGIKPGDILKLSVQGDQVSLRVSREKVGFIRRGDALVFSATAGDLLDNEIVENIRSSERGSMSVEIEQGLAHQKRQ